MLDLLSGSQSQHPSNLTCLRSNAPAHQDAVIKNFLFDTEKSQLQLHWVLAHLPSPVPDGSRTPSCWNPGGGEHVCISALQERLSSKPQEELCLSWVHESFIIVLLSSYPHAKQVRTSLLCRGDGCLQETHGSY